MKKAAKKRPGKGGARPGSGRRRKHPQGTQLVSMRLPLDVFAWMEQTGLSRSDAVTQAIRKFPAFRQWQQSPGTGQQ